MFRVKLDGTVIMVVRADSHEEARSMAAERYHLDYGQHARILLTRELDPKLDVWVVQQ